MLEYIKTILQKVSFDEYLFRKEFEKAEKHLGEKEFFELKSWCEVNFQNLYQSGTKQLSFY